MVIFYIFLTILFWAVTLYIAYIGGMAKGFQNLMDNNPDFKFGKLDAAVYSNVAGKKLKDINPVAEMIADSRIQEFKDRQKIENRKAIQKKALKKIKKSRGKK